MILIKVTDLRDIAVGELAEYGNQARFGKAIFEEKLMLG